MTDRAVAVNRVIEDAARLMTAGNIPPLRAAVVARLGRQPRLSFGVIVPATALAAAIAFAVAVHHPARHPAVTRTADAMVARADRQSPPPPRSSLASSTSVAAAAFATPDALADASVAPDPDAPTIPALPAIGGVVVSQIQPIQLDVPQLSVGHVATITPLAVAALDDVNRDR